MKVLMLGWEFPPHISGGLGTACAGLTQALEKEQVHVLFVVPKLHGGESAEGTTFINASSIPIRQTKPVSQKPKAPGRFMAAAKGSSNSIIKEFSSGTRTTIEVPSYLTPYISPDEQQNVSPFSQWNYSFTSRQKQTLSPKSKSRGMADGTHQETIIAKEPYQFSGTYGANLLEEVERYAAVAAEIAKTNSFDVIHAHDWMTYQAGLAAKKISGKPLIVHVHATEIDRSGANVNSRVFDIEKEGMALADKVVAVSQWTKNIAIKHYAIPEAKIEVVHNGINPKVENGQQPTSASFGSHIVTFLGRITHQKGPMYFVEAARRVNEQFPDAHFVVAGSGDQLPMMIERIAQLRLSANFHFTGFLRGDDVERIWAMSNVYVMPSVSEPFGIAPLEAIQAGVPVILSKQAGVSEVMPHAIKVDFWDTESFAEAICNVLRFKSLANTLKKNGAEEIKKITWDKAAKKLTTLYYELSQKHGKREKSDRLLSGSSAKKIADPAVL